MLCIAYISSRQSVFLVLRKMQVSGATELASKGQGVSDSSNVKIKGETNDSFQSDMKVRCPCGSSLETENIIKVMIMSLMFFGFIIVC